MISFLRAPGTACDVIFLAGKRLAEWAEAVETMGYA